MKTKEYIVTKYVCERCKSEYDEATEIKICPICSKDMCDDDNCELASCAVTTCKIDVCYNCSKIEKESGEIVCNNCFTKENMEEIVL